MNKVISFLFLTVLIYGCSITTNNQAKTETKTVSIVNELKRNDTVFLGYMLGSDSKSVERITDSLERENTLRGQTTVHRNYDYRGVNLKVKISGFLLSIYVGEQKTDAIMNLEFYGNKLLRQELYLLDNIPIYEQLKTKYGAGNIIPTKYVPELEVNMINFWNVSNKAIYYLKFEKSDFSDGGYDMLIYEDIILKRELIKNVAKADSLQKESIKSLNLQHSKQTKF
jgi:hypothetical protein